MHNDESDIVLKVNSVNEGKNEDNMVIRLTGPGIKEQVKCCLSGLHPQWLAKRQEWVSAFPLGIDMIFADKSHIMALPRTAILEVI